MNSPSKCKNKKAILVLGLSERDIRDVVYQTQAECDVCDEKWESIFETDIVSNYVFDNDLHPFCLDAWKEPIKNNCIVELLNRTEKCFDDDRIDVVILGGTFGINKTVRDEYVEILKDQGYVVEFKFVQTSWISLMCDSLNKGSSFLTLVTLWDEYNKSFVRQYHPIVEMHPAIIVSKYYDYCNEAINTMIKGCAESNVLIIALEDFYDNDDPKPDHIKKVDIFWSKIANYYNVQLIFEDDATTCHTWRMIGVPCISLTNPFAFKYRI